MGANFPVAPSFRPRILSAIGSHGECQVGGGESQDHPDEGIFIIGQVVNGIFVAAEDFKGNVEGMQADLDGIAGKADGSRGWC